MKEERTIRDELIGLLQVGHAHMMVDDAVKDFPEEKMNEMFPNGTYSSWGLLEHIRITQNDILEFIINPKYKDKKWPDDYWPKKRYKSNEERMG